MSRPNPANAFVGVVAGQLSDPTGTQNSTIAFQTFSMTNSTAPTITTTRDIRAPWFTVDAFVPDITCEVGQLVIVPNELGKATN